MDGGFAEYFVAINGDEEVEEELHVEDQTRQRLSSDCGIKSFVNVDDDSAGNNIRHSINDHLHRDSYSGKLFVGGVAWETTEEAFSNYFCKYGEITDSVIMMDKLTGRSRGFGFVTFADPAVANKVLAEDHVIDGRVVEVKRTVPREDMHMQVKREQKTRKIFVGGIPPSLTEDELKEYFSSYGSIAEHQIMLDHNTGRSRGFGFVSFEDEETVERIFSNGKTHELGGKQVEIKKAVPKRAGSDYANDVRMHHGGRASKSYGGFGSGAADYGGGGYNGKMRGGYGAYGGYGGYGSYEGNYGGAAAGFYEGYGGYGYGFGFWGPMYSSGGYGGNGYGSFGGYGSSGGGGGGGGGAGYGGSGGGKGYGSGGSKGYGNAGAATGRYHPYQK